MLTPAHLLYGRRIISLSYHSVEEDELDDPDFGGESAVLKRAKIQALMLKQFLDTLEIRILNNS